VLIVASVVPNSEATQFQTGKKQVEIARKGGIASGEARREKATMKKTLEMLLDTIPNIKENKDKKTFRELSTEGLMIGAVQGKAENYKLIMQVLGEMQEENTTTPEVNINIVDQSTLEKSLYENNN
jgi:hypothetical protein